jgi:tetratricopeptide (TPR) repeat protein
MTEIATEPIEDTLPPRAVPLAIAGVAFLFFVAGVYAFATFGRQYFDPLSGSIGELLVQRAQDLDQAGYVEAAMFSYQRALDTKFDDPRQRGWAQRDYGAILLREERPEEAAAVLAECLAAYPDDLKAHSLYGAALIKAEQFDTLLTAAQAWRDAAKSANDAASEATALYHIGTAYEHLEQTGNALNSYLAGHKLAPEGVNAFHAATLLHSLGEPAEALTLLDEYLKHGSGWREKSALALRSSIAAQQGA